MWDSGLIGPSFALVILVITVAVWPMLHRVVVVHSTYAPGGAKGPVYNFAFPYILCM